MFAGCATFVVNPIVQRTLRALPHERGGRLGSAKLERWMRRSRCAHAAMRIVVHGIVEGTRWTRPVLRHRERKEMAVFQKVRRHRFYLEAH